MDKIDFNFSSAQKAPPRKGRRAPTGPNSADSFGLDELQDSLPPASSPPKTSAGPIAPPRSRRTGGWADETLKSSKSKQNMPDPAEIERFQSPEHAKQDSDDDISAIPDLDDFVEEDTSPIAKAPSVQVRRVATYKELDSDLLKHTSFATLDDVNLRLLTRRLYREADLKEPDSTWTWDLLFTEVASDLNSAWEGDAVPSIN